MARAKRPVTVNGIAFDALMSEDLNLEATVPVYTVETGFPVSDAIIMEPERLEMVLFVTDTPVTWARQGGNGHARDVANQLEELYYSAQPVTVSTTEKTYTNMAITALKISKSFEIGYAKEIPIAFQKIRTTTAATTTIPDSYGKSGKSEASAGSANTENGSVGTGSGTGANGGGSGNGSGDGGGSGGGASMLYAAADTFTNWLS